MTKRFLAWAFDQAAWRFSAFQVLRPLESIAADCGSQGSDGLECLVVEVRDPAWVRNEMQKKTCQKIDLTIFFDK